MSESIKQRIRKLLVQAEDQVGTPEGDAFQAKAFDLMARYGMTMRDIPRDDSCHELRIEFTGHYSDMQANLLAKIASALSCVTIAIGRHRSTKVSEMMVFALPHHLERVEFLFQLLNLSMLSAARNVNRQFSVVTARRSFMMGFAWGVAQRLATAEQNIAQEYAVALVDDLSHAHSAREEYEQRNNMRAQRKRSSYGIDPEAVAAGESVAREVDIGQSRLRSRKALF